MTSKAKELDVISLLDTAEIPRSLVRFIILFQQRQVPKIRKCCNQCVCAQFIWKFKSDRNHGRKEREVYIHELAIEPLCFIITSLFKDSKSFSEP